MQVEDEKIESEVSTDTKVADKAAGASAKPSYEELESFRDRAVTDNVKYRQKNAEYKDQIKQLEEQARRAVELEEQLSQTQAKARERIADVELWALARAEGLEDRELLKLLDKSSLEFDEEDNPTNAAEVLAAFKSAKPRWFSSVSTSSVHKAPEPSKTVTDANDITDEEWARFRKKPSAFKL